MRLVTFLTVTAFLAAAQQTEEVHVSGHVYNPPALHLSATTTLVQVEAVVRDPKGHVVSGLKQTDFEILDEGKPRPITVFSVETHAPGASKPPEPSSAIASTPVPAPATPRATMLYFDDLHVTQAEMQRMQAAATRFVRNGLGAGTHGAIFSSTQGLTLDFTTDGDALVAAIQKLRAHPHLSENGLQPCPRITPYTAYMIDHLFDYTALNAAVQEFESCSSADSTQKSTKAVARNPKPGDPHANAVYSVQAQASATMQQVRSDSLASFDAIDKALALLAKAPATRILLMVSSGFLAGMLDTDRDEVVDRAIRSFIVINALDAKGLWSESAGRVSDTVGDLPLATFVFETTTIGSRNDAMNNAMQEFASGTGGLFFHNSNDLADGLAQLGATPETVYQIAFAPEMEGGPGTYHKLKVRLASKSGDYVQARPRYVTPGKSEGGGPPAPRAIDREAADTDVRDQIPVTLGARMGTGAPNSPSLSVVIHVDVKALKFSERGDRHLQKLMFIGELLDASGKLVAAKEGAMDFALKDDTLARLTASGVNATLGLNAPPGPYKVRVVVEDAEGKMAAQNQTVEIPK